jgi:hypothetical protein
MVVVDLDSLHHRPGLGGEVGWAGPWTRRGVGGWPATGP